VPFFFVLDPLGVGVLLKLPAGGSWAEAGWIIFLGFFAIAALAAGLQGWIVQRANAFERGLLITGGLLVISPLNNLDIVGVGVALLAVVLQFVRRRAAAPA
jgi:TRAP-type uncharacterized transport system fused permease subunit